MEMNNLRLLLGILNLISTDADSIPMDIDSLFLSIDIASSFLSTDVASSFLSTDILLSAMNFNTLLLILISDTLSPIKSNMVSTIHLNMLLFMINLLLRPWESGYNSWTSYTNR